MLRIFAIWISVRPRIINSAPIAFKPSIILESQLNTHPMPAFTRNCFRAWCHGPLCVRSGSHTPAHTPLSALMRSASVAHSGWTGQARQMSRRSRRVSSVGIVVQRGSGRQEARVVQWGWGAAVTLRSPRPASRVVPAR